MYQKGEGPKSNKVEEVENVVEPSADNESDVKIEEIEENISEDDGDSVEDVIEIQRKKNRNIDSIRGL